MNIKPVILPDELLDIIAKASMNPECLKLDFISSSTRTALLDTLSLEEEITSGNLYNVKLLIEDGNYCSVALKLAAENGHLETVKWLHSNRTEGCTKDAMNHAASRGHLEIMKWLHSYRTEGCILHMLWTSPLRKGV